MVRNKRFCCVRKPHRSLARNADRFAYNRRGEVASATVAGEPSAYAYDGIGNFTAVIGGAVTNTYAANELNQYEEVESNGATVEPTYTSNGELASFGDWTYAYDALSRLTAAYSNGTLVVSNRYDHLGRRIAKIALDGTHTFLYDGWRPVVETVARVGGGTDRIEYHWGKDLSGTLDGAAGVGGLLYVKRNGAIYVPFGDAFGNVMGYWDEQGNVVAEYVHDAFGRTVAQSGPMADVFAIRYSSKYYDVETGMYYYGKRYYVVTLCRWLTRDPIEDQGGVNLYGFCSNGSCYKTDFRGMFELTLISDYTVEGDVLCWYLFGGLGNRIRRNMHSESDMIDAMENQILCENELITVLNISGHGATGSGFSFANEKEFNIANENSKARKLLSNYLAPNATIRIWSCDAASTYEKCSALQKAADDIGAEIYAKTGDVFPGPDGGPLVQGAGRIAAWIVGHDPSTWKVFKPKPMSMLQGKSFLEGPKAYKILKREIRLK